MSESTGLKNHLIKNYIYNAVYQIFAVIAPLITTPYISRVLGATGIGIFGYTDSIAKYFILFGTLGSNLYGQREIAYVQDDIKKRTIVFKEIITFRFLTVFIVGIVYMATFCRTGRYKHVFLILALEVFASAFDVSWFFQGIQDFKKAVMRNIIIKSLSICFVFLFVKSNQDVNIYALCYVLPVLISNLSLWAYLPKYLIHVERNKFITLKHMIPLITLFITQIATEVYTVLDKTMLGILASDINQVGYYEQSSKMIKVLVYFITALGIVMLPQMSKLFVEGRTAEIQKNIKQSFQFIFFLGFPLMFGIIGIAANFVPWFYGEGYTPVILLISAISPIIVIIGISNVIGKQYLLPTRHQKTYTISVILGAIVNCILNLLLIPIFNALGASIATVTAELSVTIIQIWFVRKDIPIFSYLKEAIRYLCVGMFMFVIIFCVGIITPSGVVGIIVQSCIGMLIYFSVLALIKDDMLKRGFNIISGLLFMHR